MKRAPLREMALLPKLATDQLGTWKPLPAPPRFTPFIRSLRADKGWSWRATEAAAGDHRFLVLGTVSVRLGQYRAWLLHHHQGAWRLVARLEDHGDHPGLHLHAWCPGELPEAGTASIAAPQRFPERRPRRCVQGDTPDAFWAVACATFRVILPLRPKPVQEQLL